VGFSETQTQMDERVSLIYIMGRGRSGSTVLAELLGHSTDIQNVGELVSSMERTCGCGVPFTECEFWQRVRAEFERDSGKNWDQSRGLLKRQAYLPRFLGTLLAGRDSSEVQALVSVNRSLVQGILNASGVECVVDASKELTRALFLMRHLPDTRFVHLVRKPENVVASYRHRIRHGKVSFLRHEYHEGLFNFLFLALIGVSWVMGNLLAESVRLLSPARVMHVRYEDLCDDPARELKRLGAWLECDMGPVIEAVEHRQPMEIGHIIKGNYRMREGVFVFDPQIGTSRQLPWFYAWMVKVMCWPLKLFYGYTLW
jgi:hypothetical protein